MSETPEEKQLGDANERIQELERQCAEFKRLGQQFEREMRTHFEQSCKNLERAEKAERERDEADDLVLEATKEGMLEGFEKGKEAAAKVAEDMGVERLNYGGPSSGERIAAAIRGLSLEET